MPWTTPGTSPPAAASGWLKPRRAAARCGPESSARPPCLERRRRRARGNARSRVACHVRIAGRRPRAMPRRRPLRAHHPRAGCCAKSARATQRGAPRHDRHGARSPSSSSKRRERRVHSLRHGSPGASAPVRFLTLDEDRGEDAGTAGERGRRGRARAREALKRSDAHCHRVAAGRWKVGDTMLARSQTQTLPKHIAAHDDEREPIDQRPAAQQSSRKRAQGKEHGATGIGATGPVLCGRQWRAIRFEIFACAPQFGRVRNRNIGRRSVRAAEFPHRLRPGLAARRHRPGRYN